MKTVSKAGELRAQLRREVGIRGRLAHLLRVARVLGDYFRLEKRIEGSGLEALREKYRPLLTGGSTALEKGKYLRLGGYLRRDLGRAVELGLHRERPMSILDLGSGPGYFLLVCEHFGHSAQGLDVAPDPDEPRDLRVMHEFYSDMIDLLGVRRTYWAIRPFEALPELPGEPFDVVTANQASFHQESLPAPWGASEWQFFLEDIWSKTTPEGRLVMMLNPDVEAGALVRPEVRRLFESFNAQIEGWTVSLTHPAAVA